MLGHSVCFHIAISLGEANLASILTAMLHTEDHRNKTEGFCSSYPRFSGGGRTVEVVEALNVERIFSPKL